MAYLSMVSNLPVKIKVKRIAENKYVERILNYFNIYFINLSSLVLVIL